MVVQRSETQGIIVGGRQRRLGTRQVKQSTTSIGYDSGLRDAKSLIKVSSVTSIADLMWANGWSWKEEDRPLLSEDSNSVIHGQL